MFDFRSYKEILPFFRRRRQKTAPLFPELFQHLHSDSCVVDIGCGDGRMAIKIAESTGARVRAIDNEESAVLDARTNVVDAGLEECFDIQLGGWRDQQLIGNTFDLVLCAHLLYHIEPNERREFLDAMLEMNSPGGRLIFITTSRVGAVHNFFCGHQVVSNIINRGRNLESAYGHYVFGEDLDDLLSDAGVSANRRAVTFEVGWPYGQDRLRHARHTQGGEIEGAWTKFFSFLYRLPVELILEEFGGELRKRLAASDFDLRIQSRDIIHVIKR